MDKFDDMIKPVRVAKVNERRTIFVLEEIANNSRLAGQIRSDARKIVHVLKSHKQFKCLTKFGLLTIFASYEIGKSLRSALPWLAEQKSLTATIYAPSEHTKWDDWADFLLTDSE